MQKWKGYSYAKSLIEPSILAGFMQTMLDTSTIVIAAAAAPSYSLWMFNKMRRQKAKLQTSGASLWW
jgi:hypothetical protein